MSAIEACRTAALGGYVARCENAECAHTVISYCSCRNRHCPKCQGSQALAWMEERKAELLQVTTSTSSSRCPQRSERSLTKTRPQSTLSCSKPPPRPC